MILRTLKQLLIPALLVISASVLAQNSMSPAAQAMVDMVKAGQGASAALKTSVEANKAEAGGLVYASIKHAGLDAAEAVRVALAAAPSQQDAIIQAAIQAAPNSTQEIVSAALKDAPRDQVMKVVNAAVQAKPDASQDIITAAVVAKPEMVEEIVVGVAEQVISIAEQNPDYSSDLVAVLEDEDAPSFAASGGGNATISTRSYARSARFERTSLQTSQASPN